MSTKKTPLVSFLLPVYNAEKFIAQTLNSILEQTYENFEIIAIDDGSKDKSLQILKKYQKIDKRIKVFNRDNKGLVVTLNEAIQKSSGELLARIDADDCCMPKRLEWQVSAMVKNQNAALCHGFYEIFDEDSEYLSKVMCLSNKNDIKRAMYIKNPIAHSSVMLRKKLLPQDPYNPNVGPTEDYELWSKLAIENDIICIPRIIMRYRANSNGIMSTVGDKQYIYMPINLTNYWNKAGDPIYYKPKEIREKMLKYINNKCIKSDLRAHLAWLFLDNESQLAMKCISRKKIKLGLKILTSVAFSSKTGLKVSFARIKTVIRGRLFKK